MCGVIGVVTKEAGYAASFRNEVDRVLDLFSYRGPDAKGLWEDANVLLGHRRLSIIDLSDWGAQPLHDYDHGLHISFNGEIYNFKELKKETEARGYRFRTGADTEVILGAYNCFGDGFEEKLRGMFAFILYDERHGKIVLCRDRLGKKPLYYSLDDRRLIAASELKAFYAFRDMSLSLDMESLRSFFCLQYIPGPWTILNEVKRIEPGECMTLHINSWDASRQRYWSLYAQETNAGASAGSSGKELAELISESTRLRLIADVEVGVMLSGGVDSSLLSCYASEISQIPLKAFVVSFDREDLDEAPYARKVASALGMELVEVEGGAFDASVFERVLFHADEPLGDPACIPTFMISEAIARHVKVVISGEGADELFWGYTHYKREILLQKLFPSGFSFPFAQALRPVLLRGETAPAPGGLSRLCKLLGSERDIGVSRWTLIFGEPGSAGLFSADCIRPDSTARFALQMNKALNAYSVASTLTEASIATDLSFFLPDNLLIKVDRMTMAHGIEARAPFLDHKLVEYALRMPSSEKADPQRSKKVLRRLLAAKLPSDIASFVAYRRKHGLDVPLHRWMRSELREVAEACFSESMLRELGFLNEKLVRRLWCELINRGGPLSYARKVWLLLCFLSWHGLHARRFNL